MKKMKLTAYDVLCFGDDDYYYFCNEFNMLIRSSGANEKEIVGHIPEEKLCAGSLVSQMILANDKIVLVPLNAKKIWIYEIDSQKWQGIEIEDENCEYKFMRAVQEGYRLYLLPCRYKKMIVLDISTKQISYIDIEDKERGICGSIFFRSDVVRKENVVYAAYCGGDYVFEFNIIEEIFEWKKVGANCTGYSGIVFCNNKFWLLPKLDEKRVICWDGDSAWGEVKIMSYNSGVNRGLAAINNKVYVMRDNDTIVINCDVERDEGERKTAYFFFENNNSISFLQYDSQYTLIKDNITHTITLELLHEVIHRYFKANIHIEEFITDTKVVRESELIGIEELLKVVANY